MSAQTSSERDSPIAGQALSNNLHLEFVDPDSLKPYPNNPHKHPKQQIEQLRISLRANGVIPSLLVDENGMIIDGEAVWRAAKLEGITSIPIVRVLGLTETQKRKLRIGLNKHPENAAWDLDELRIEIKAILAIEINFDPGEIGMSVGGIDKLLIAKESDPDDDTIPPIPDRAVSRPGEIYICGKNKRHRIGCGDGRDTEFLSRVIGQRLIDCCITDPPYNKKVLGGATTGRGRTRHAEFAMASGEMSDDEFQRFLEDSLRLCAKFSRDGAVHFVFMDHLHIDDLLAVGKRIYTQRLNICVWNKSNAGLGGLYRNKCEFIAVFKVGEAAYFNAVQLGKHGRSRTTVWDSASVNTFGSARRLDLELHPTVKPTGLVADAIMDVTRRGDVVFDGFLGSGTALLACERTGRQFRGVEISPHYVDLALTRWMERTGEEPILESTGQTFSELRAERLREEASHG